MPVHNKSSENSIWGIWTLWDYTCILLVSFARKLTVSLTSQNYTTPWKCFIHGSPAMSLRVIKSKWEPIVYLVVLCQNMLVDFILLFVSWIHFCDETQRNVTHLSRWQTQICSGHVHESIFKTTSQNTCLPDVLSCDANLNKLLGFSWWNCSLDLWRILYMGYAL